VAGMMQCRGISPAAHMPPSQLGQAEDVWATREKEVS
jgi:hypothetical protein